LNFKLINIYYQSLIKRLFNPTLIRCNKLRIYNSELILNTKTRIFGTLILVNNSKIEINNGVVLSKTSILEAIGKNASIKLFENVVIGEYSIIGTVGKIMIQKGVTTSRNFNCGGDVFIGSYTLIGPNVFISSGKHHIDGKDRIRDLDNNFYINNGKHFSEKIIIGANSWLGANVVILPGVVLGEGCVVAANSVVTRSFDAYSIIGGVPAKLIKNR
jgi:acetyltransferase-like isoleucine patch superfamily enzyme